MEKFEYKCNCRNSKKKSGRNYECERMFSFLTRVMFLESSFSKHITTHEFVLGQYDLFLPKSCIGVLKRACFGLAVVVIKNTEMISYIRSKELRYI